jgi:NAD(P)-dependent dehydrogenase (short-subunit alcohol dehydrogenase family)
MTNAQTNAGHVLVVGGTKGLGRVVANRFLASNHKVTVLSRTSAGAAGISHITADLETLTSADAIVSEALRIGGALRYLVFCQRYRSTGDAWQGEIQVGLTATRLLTEGFADHFVQDGDRAIGVVSSVYADFVGGSQPAGYHVVKAGLNQLVRYYAWTMGRKGVRANAIMPLTFMKPESRDVYMANRPLQQAYDQFVPLRRMGDAEDSANLIEFLCSDKAAFVNGQCIFVDGGVSVVWPEELARSFHGV